MTIQRLGSISFSMAIGALGVFHLLMDHFQRARPDSVVPMVLVYSFLEFLFWTGLIVLSTGILTSSKSHLPAKWMGWLMFIWITIRHIPLLISDPTNPQEWNFTCMAFAICGGAFIVAGSDESFSKVRMKFTRSIRFPSCITMGQILSGAALLVLGFQHMLYADFISSMIPSWIPLRNVWAWITGIALMTSGISFLFNLKISWASMALSMMVLSWTIILHLPRIISRPQDFYEWIYCFQALAIATSAVTLFGVQSQSSTSTESLAPRSANHITVDLIKQASGSHIIDHFQQNHKSNGGKSKSYQLKSPIKR